MAPFWGELTGSGALHIRLNLSATPSRRSGGEPERQPPRGGVEVSLRGGTLEEEWSPLIPEPWDPTHVWAEQPSQTGPASLSSSPARLGQPPYPPPHPDWASLPILLPSQTGPASLSSSPARLGQPPYPPPQPDWASLPILLPIQTGPASQSSSPARLGQPPYPPPQPDWASLPILLPSQTGPASLSSSPARLGQPPYPPPCPCPSLPACHQDRE
ncbi:calcium-binding protein P-like [Osmerus mordax]|uniref:calcium-binding protein P-like n=1 Tax=Osmerus mordax TaxID=8014 RepID=UPI00350FF337